MGHPGWQKGCAGRAEEEQGCHLPSQDQTGEHAWQRSIRGIGNEQKNLLGRGSTTGADQDSLFLPSAGLTEPLTF